MWDIPPKKHKKWMIKTMPLSVAWIFPQKKECGIALYAKNALATLERECRVVVLDPLDFIHNKKQWIKALHDVDVVHINFEISLFMYKEKEFFLALIKSLRKPVCITIHEVYDQIPGIYSRTALRGRGFVLWAKQKLYDYQHPAQVALTSIVKHKFGCNNLIVHYDFQQGQLVNMGIPLQDIKVVAHGIPSNAVKKSPRNGIDVVRLGAVGFLTATYDYDLLCRSLVLLDIPWTFTWIGGPRPKADPQAQDKFIYAIKTHGLEDRITITGWQEDANRDRQLSNLDICVALFKSRSSSGSLAAALGSGLPIVASTIPLTKHLAEKTKSMVLVTHEPEKIMETIVSLCKDYKVRTILSSNALSYGATHSYQAMGNELLSIYKHMGSV